MFADVSDRAARDRLSRELSAIVTSSDDAILSKDLDGTVRSWNAAAERLYGYSASEAIGRSIALIVPDEHASEIGEILREIAADRRVEHYETVRRRKDGTLVDVSLSVSPVHDGGGKVVAASVISRDVSGRRAMEIALKESERRRMEILASMLRAEEAERSRIATELHDDTVQVMTASLFALDRVALVARRSENPSIESAVTLTRATLEEATARARRLMFELRPAILHEHGLVAAVSVLADQTRRETGAQTTVFGRPPRYGHDVEELAYRSIQEALVNARKHSEATAISITLEDDGRGTPVRGGGRRPGIRPRDRPGPSRRSPARRHRLDGRARPGGRRRDGDRLLAGRRNARAALDPRRPEPGGRLTTAGRSRLPAPSPLACP